MTIAGRAPEALHRRGDRDPAVAGDEGRDGDRQRRQHRPGAAARAGRCARRARRPRRRGPCRRPCRRRPGVVVLTSSLPTKGGTAAAGPRPSRSRGLVEEEADRREDEQRDGGGDDEQGRGGTPAALPRPAQRGRPCGSAATVGARRLHRLEQAHLLHQFDRLAAVAEIGRADLRRFQAVERLQSRRRRHGAVQRVLPVAGMRSSRSGLPR